jgi:hypothetical protein
MIDRQFTFLGSSPAIFVLGCICVVAVVVMSAIIWRRSNYSPYVGGLELLRIALISMVVLTLNQPEFLEEFVPKERPTLVVLWDQSLSMNTRDVIDPNLPAAKPKTRAEVVAEWIDPKVWASLNEKMDVVIEPFASSAEPVLEGTDINHAIQQALDKYNNLRGVVLMSDGDWNVGNSPVGAATQLRLKGVPVYAMGTGGRTRLPDVEVVAVDAPTIGVVNKPLRIPFVIDNWLPRDHNVTVTLTSKPDGKKITKDIRLPAMGRLQDTISWTPEKDGAYELTLDVPPDERELLTENNTRTVPIKIQEETLKVLLIESFPRWEYRYLRNALERDPGVEVSCLLFLPGLSKVGGGRGYLTEFPKVEELAKFDVVFLGDVGVQQGQLDEEDCQQIAELVRTQASGVVFMPGFRGNHLTLVDTALKDVIPVVFDENQPRGWGSPTAGQFDLTATGRRSLLTKLEENDDANARTWETLPGFQWYCAVERAKAGTETLATHRTESNGNGRIPLIVTRTYGAGKILYMGTDGAWRWREGVEDKYHYRFWGQVARWMAYQRNMAKGEFLRLFYSPDRPQVGDVVTLNANAMSSTGEPLQKGKVVVQMISPSGKASSVRLDPGTGDSWGLFHGDFRPEEPGEYKLIVSCADNGGVLETSLNVQGVSREKLGKPARLEVLEEIAKVTQGEMLEWSSADTLITKIAAMPDPEPRVRRLRIWAHPFWAIILITLLGLFWTGRKMVGSV